MIELKQEDADGRGGDILMSMGMKRSSTTPNHFRALVLSEPDDPHWDDRDLAMPYIEALRDEDITPRRVKVKTRSVPYNMMTSSAQPIVRAWDEEGEEGEAEEPDEPQEDDLVTEDHSNFYMGHKKVLTVDPEATEHEMWLELIKYMKKSHFYPNVWFISDHGNSHLMSPPKGMHLPGE